MSQVNGNSSAYILENMERRERENSNLGNEFAALNGMTSVCVPSKVALITDLSRCRVKCRFKAGTKVLSIFWGGKLGVLHIVIMKA